MLHGTNGNMFVSKDHRNKLMIGLLSILQSEQHWGEQILVCVKRGILNAFVSHALNRIVDAISFAALVAINNAEMADVTAISWQKVRAGLASEKPAWIKQAQIHATFSNA